LGNQQVFYAKTASRCYVYKAQQIYYIMKTLLTTILLILSFSFASANENTPVANNNTTNVLSHEVFFNTDSHTITNEEFTKLLNFVKTIETVDIDRVSVHGFTDDRGSYNYNLPITFFKQKSCGSSIS